MLRLFQVDAFTDRLFGGNPAAVVPLDQWIEDSTLQNIAMENNLAETAFIVPAKNSQNSGFELRWFTPVSEVALCGHATLAAAHVLTKHLGYEQDHIDFFTRKSGTLRVTRGDDRALSMSFPSIPLRESHEIENVAAALNAQPTALFTGNYSDDEFDFVAVMDSESQVAAVVPQTGRFQKLNSRGVIVTAPGEGCDFVFALLCTVAWHRRRSSHRISSLSARSILGTAIGQKDAAGPPNICSWRQTSVPSQR